MLDINYLRKEYHNKPLDIKDVCSDPFEQFNLWFTEAQQAQVIEPNAMILATASAEAIPSARTVLLKQVDWGFLFFTNYGSRKAHELMENPRASLIFLWKELERQAIIEGHVEKASREESIEYFKKRPRKSQLGAWASNQDKILSSRQELEKAYREIEYSFENKEIPTPHYWGGFRVIPHRFEFWQGRENRLHDRLCYTQKEEGIWQIDRLSP